MVGIELGLHLLALSVILDVWDIIGSTFGL